MPICRLCGAYFPNWLEVEGKPRNLSSRKYCLDCSPRGRHNTRVLEPRARSTADLSAALPDRKTCPRCNQEKPIGEFYLLPGGQRSHVWCKFCNNEHRKARFREDRYLALLHYSHGDIKCHCCGERNIEFLSLDHIKDDGAEHRRSIGVHRGGGQHFSSWLRKTGYTYADLAVSCHNCNMARALYGQCPHKAEPL